MQAFVRYHVGFPLSASGLKTSGHLICMLHGYLLLVNDGACRGLYKENLMNILIHLYAPDMIKWAAVIYTTLMHI